MSIFYSRYFMCIALVALLCSCNNQQQVSATAAAVITADTALVFILHDTGLTKSIELPAELLPLERAELAARVQGYVKDLKVDIGDKVSSGQTLAIIEAPELNTKYAEYEASLATAKAKYISSTDVYERMKKAAQAKTAGIVAPVDLERSKNQYIADSASYESARKLAQSYKEMAGYLVIRAPFSGIITARNVDRGALVGTDQKIFTIENLQTLRLRVAVPELYTATGSTQKENQFRIDAYPEKTFTATLARKSGSIDATTRTELWEYRYNNNEGLIKAGSFAYIKLSVQRNGHSFIVPQTAIATTQERKFVIKVKNGKALWVDVRQGLSTDKGIEIFGNINSNDTLLARASDERKEGTNAVWKVVKQ